MKTVLPKKMKRLIGKINHRVCGSKTYDEIYVSVVIVSATRRIRDIKNTVLSVGAHAEKFNIVSNDHGRTHKCDFSVFHQKYPFLGKYSPKNQNSQFKLKLGTKTNSNMQNSIVLFTFSVLDQNHPFFDKFGQKNEIAFSS